MPRRVSCSRACIWKFTSTKQLYDLDANIPRLNVETSKSKSDCVPTSVQTR